MPDDTPPIPVGATYDLARLAAAEARYDGPIPAAVLLGARDDPAAAVLAIYRARARAYRCMAQTALRDLKKNPGHGILHRRFLDYRERFRDLNRFYWKRRRALGWDDFKRGYRARQAAKREAAE